MDTSLGKKIRHRWRNENISTRNYRTGAGYRVTPFSSRPRFQELITAIDLRTSCGYAQVLAGADLRDRLFSGREVRAGVNLRSPITRRSRALTCNIHAAAAIF